MAVFVATTEENIDRIIATLGLKEMTQGGFGENSHHKDGESYMMKADIPQLRAALSSGACSTSPFATCVVKNWLKSAKS